MMSSTGMSGARTAIGCDVHQANRGPGWQRGKADCLRRRAPGELVRQEPIGS
jgi:hypothetical protein